MILISHRGNTNGKNINRENTKSYIDEAIAKGFDVEIDICKWDGVIPKPPSSCCPCGLQRC